MFSWRFLLKVVEQQKRILGYFSLLKVLCLILARHPCHLPAEEVPDDSRPHMRKCLVGFQGVLERLPFQSQTYLCIQSTERIFG
mmetsp:Transcript_43055/g.31433  ORF Transcript_43055/g.31433 Transcript_43055/m.31433 type:complete len:84 (+) Transcript_43055:1691-1942(+)